MQYIRVNPMFGFDCHSYHRLYLHVTLQVICSLFCILSLLSCPEEHLVTMFLTFLTQ